MTDLLPNYDGSGQPDEVISSLARLRHGGHDVIVFHVLDEAEVNFPYSGSVEFEDAESGQTITVDASEIRNEYLEDLEEFRQQYRHGCDRLRIDYVPLDTSTPFDKALTEYLIQRQNRF